MKRTGVARSCSGVVLVLMAVILSVAVLLSGAASGKESLDRIFTLKINPMVGGGGEGEVLYYTFNSAGDVYRTHAPSFKDTPKTELIRKIDAKTVTSMKDSLMKAKVFEMKTQGPHYSEKAWHIIIDGKETKIYFGATPKNLERIEKQVNDIIQGR